MSEPESRICSHLRFLYGDRAGADLWPRLQERLSAFRKGHPEFSQGVPAPSERLTQRDVILITYGDQISEPGCSPLQTLAAFLETYVREVITGVHLLPFFPYSSDDGFSVIDYMAVNPSLGNWEDIRRLGESFRLMFDSVINHISAQSAWFQAFLAGAPEFADAFLVVDPDTDLSQVVRPRALPLLTPVCTVSGEEKWVWTTFSVDQIDLNFADPGVLLRIVDVLLFYVEQGAEIIRLDAIAYLWKTIGTPCIHLEETHRVVKLFRAVLDWVAPGVMLITETNVPHEENVSYFGDGSDEAQLVYQFPLPPLVLHALATGDASHLTAWASGLSLPSQTTTFYNFLASHDGIGVRPVEGILAPEDVRLLADRTLAHGGQVSYKANADGSQSIYELNISYFDAISSPQADEPPAVQVSRFMVSQAIMLALQGVPGIYVHSLLGSRNDQEGLRRTGRARSINREKLRRAELEAVLADPSSLRHAVFTAYCRLIRARTAHAAFHPNGAQQVLPLHPALFSVLRVAPDDTEPLLCVHNVSDAPVSVPTDFAALLGGQGRAVCDVITGELVSMADGYLHCAPYQVLWLKGL